jgi:sulfur-oxidizing protein SoxB
MSHLNRRELLQLLAAASVASASSGCATRSASNNESLYQAAPFGSVRLIHFTDCHAQLMPIYFREPSMNLGFGEAKGRLPHIVGDQLLKELGVTSGTASAHAFSYLNFTDGAREFGKVGGFAHMKTLIDSLRADYADGASLLLDGGDTWQGSGTSLWTRGKDMVGACNLLGVDIMTGHWEFTYQDHEVLENIAAFNGEFLAQNVRVKEDALFDGADAFDEDSGHAFKPYSIKVMAGRRIAIVGQAFPYTPVANPSRFIPDWSFGIRADELQELVDDIRANEKPDAVVLLSHNGMDVDLKVARVVTGIDAILGGHTHDGVPVPIEVQNSKGRTIVTNAGSNGKFVATLDFEFDQNGVSDYRYRLMPVFSRLLTANAEMQAYISDVRAPYQSVLSEKLAVAGELLFRRGNFNGTFDQVICDAQRAVGDAQISLSPGFRWGTTVLPGQSITMEHVLDQTCITYPETYIQEMSGEQIKLILEDVADNLFHKDPFYQQGGDMVRLGGMNYSCDPLASAGKRISDMELPGGERLSATKKYKVAGWATVGSKSPGAPIWDVVAEYLRDQKSELKISNLNTPKLKNVANNPGYAP